ncbi:MAG TPA: Flp family type IVb pilin, partial [Holosporales bacterium]|nr:Flp family type IVb pilin [Holosporales bacterium]
MFKFILVSLLKKDVGVTALEYVLIATLISALIVVSVELLGIKVGTLYQ